MRVLAILSSAQSVVYKVHDSKWDEETNHFFINKLNIFVNRKRKMVNFDLGEEIERYFSSCQKPGTEKKFPWVPMRNGTSDLGILCSDALPLSHRNSMTNKAIKKLSKLKVYHLFYCSCEKGSIDIADPSNMLDSCHIWTLKWSCSPQRLSGRASECGIQRSEVQFLLASWWLRIFSLSHTCDKTRNIFL